MSRNVPSAIQLKKEANTRLDPISMACLDAKQDKLRASLTQMLIRTKVNVKQLP